MKRISRLFFGALIASGLPLAAGAACVNPGGTGGCFASIQAAIDGAQPNETVDIAAGVYYQNRIRMNRQVNLVGAGRGLTIIDGSIDNGDGTRRNGAGPGVIYYSSFFDPQVTTTISDLTIRGGYRGVDAGRFNTTTLLRVRLTANGPGSGAGAFINAERLIVRESLIDHNNAVDGLGCDWYWDGGGGGGLGAGCGGGTIQVYDSVVTDNTAAGLGGGILMGGYDDVVENTIVANNSAGDYGRPGNFGVGGALLSGFGRIRYSTFANNAGGGLFASEAMTLVGSLVQGNTGPGGNCWNGVPTSLGYNIAADATCAFNHPTDLVSTPVAMVTENDPLLGMPVTRPDTSSVAIDRVPAAACDIAADIGDVARPQGAGCDAGAVEWVQPPPALCVNTSGQGGCFATIAAAIAAAPDGATINVAQGWYSEGNLLIDKSLTIVGSGIVSVDAGIPVAGDRLRGADPVFRLPASGPPVDVVLKNLQVSRGYRGIDAGANNDLTLDTVVLAFNGPGSGAGLLNYTSRVNIIRGLIFNNTAGDALSCRLSGGIGRGNGGGVAQMCGDGQGYIRIRDTSIHHNTATFAGGGVFIDGNGYLLENVTLDANTASGWEGGGAFLFGSGAVRYATVSGNTAAGSSGGVWVSFGTADFFANLIQGNSGAACNNGSLSSQGYNVVSDATCNVFAPTDRRSTSVALGPLSFFGGPDYIWTRPAPPGSASVDIIPPAQCASDHDARGAARPQGGGCDAGAHEGTWP